MKLRPFLRVRIVSAVAGLFLSAAAMLAGAPVRVEFASAEQGRKELTKVDEFVQRLSPFDRAGRVKSSAEVAEAQYLTHVGQSVKDWTAAEKERVTAALATVRPELERMKLSWPDPVWLVRTTGAEEGNAAYTRGTAIVLPDSQFDGDEPLAGLLAHEFFHVLSRRNPALKDALYAVIGFKPCAEIRFDPALAARKITNPDAPRNDHAIELTVRGRKQPMVPVLISRTARYDAAGGGEFFGSMELRFAPAGTGRPIAEADLVPQNGVSGFVEQIGRNTGYVIHPEEILADNFKLLVLKTPGVRSPAILEALGKALAGAGSVTPVK